MQPCPHCGHENADGTRYCGNCGKLIGAERTRRRLRRWLVGLLVVLSSVGIVGSTIAIWAHQTLFDTDRFVETVGPILDEPEVQQALSVRIADEIVQGVDLEGRLQSTLPEQITFLAGPLTDRITGFVQEQTENFLASDLAQQLWTDAVGFAHDQVVSFLRGEEGALTARDGQVTLNLVPLINEAINAINSRESGLLADVELPQITEQSVEEARAKLADALGLDLSDDFGQIVVFDSDELAAAQEAVKLFDRLVILLVVLTVVLIAVAILASVNRRRTLVQLAVGAVIALILARVFISRIEENIASLARDETGFDALTATLNQVFSGLRDLTLALLIAGAVIAVVAFLAGKPRWFAAARRKLGEATKDFGPDHPWVVWAKEHTDGLRIGGIIAAVLILLLLELTWWTAIVVLGILGLYELGVAYLGGWRPSFPRRARADQSASPDS